MAVIIVPITKIAQANQDRFDICSFLPSAERWPAIPLDQRQP
jgi:maltodextrin utilization protein YvdJ